MTRLGSMLKLWRTVNGYSLRHIAALTGISYATLCRIEQGKPMDAKLDA